MPTREYSNVHQFYPPPSPYNPTRIGHMSDVDQLVDGIIHRLSQSHLYTGLGRVLDELYTKEAQHESACLGPIFTLPAALEICSTNDFMPCVKEAFLQHSSSSVSPLHKPTGQQLYTYLKECICTHRYRLPSCSTNARSIQHWWESAFTHFVLVRLGHPGVNQTFNQNDTYNLYQLAPYGIRINGFASLLEQLQQMLRPEALNKAARLAEQMLDNDIGRLYHQFQLDLLGPERAVKISNKKPFAALKHLAKCATKLHEQLQSWAANNQLVWPSGYLDSLLVFGQFLQRISASGPFRPLVHLLIVASSKEGLDLDRMLSRLLKSAESSGGGDDVIDLTQDDNDSLGPSKIEASSFDDQQSYSVDSNLVQRCLNFLNTLQIQPSSTDKSTDAALSPGQRYWLALADLENQLFPQSSSSSKSTSCRQDSLVSLLAQAANSGRTELPFPSNQPESSPSTTTNRNRSDDDGMMKETESTEKDTDRHDPEAVDYQFDPSAVCRFVHKLTCLRTRSVEQICQLTADYLGINQCLHFTTLRNCVDTLLTDMGNRRQRQSTSGTQLSDNLFPVYYHCFTTPSHDLGEVKDKHQSQTTSSSHHQPDSIPTSLLTSRDAVLALLASCPSLTDLTEWTLWSTTLEQRWGRLEDFLVECGPTKVRLQHNLVAVQLLDDACKQPRQLIRFTASPSAPVASLFAQLSSPSHPSLASLLDACIGCVMGVNDLLIDDLSSTLGSALTGSPSWIEFLRDVLIITPLVFLPILFQSLLISCLDAVGLYPRKHWSEDVGQLLSSLFYSATSNEVVDSSLITAVGCLGFHLNWPAFQRCFEQRRLLSATNLPTSRAMLTLTVDSRCEVTNQYPKTVDLSSNTTTKSFDPQPVPLSATATTLAKPFNFASIDQSESSWAQFDAPDLVESRRKFVEELRRREFGCGLALSEEVASLVQRMEGKLNRSLVRLSRDLYHLPGHFLLELLQNADDNDYSQGQIPRLDFCLVVQSQVSTHSIGLLVSNNEAVGFTESDLSALCDVGQSTKADQRSVKTGRKGIGFKSVFTVTNAPEVHSNGFHVKFSSHHTGEQHSSMNGGPTLIPEWCHPVSVDQSAAWPTPISCVPPWARTLLVLPFINNERHYLGLVIRLIDSTIQPSLMLFLRRLQLVTFNLSTLDAKSSKQPQLCLTRSWIDLESTVATNRFARFVLVNAVRSGDQEQQAKHYWFTFTERLGVDSSQLQSDAQTNSPTLFTDISIGINLTDREPLPPCPIFAYLPVRDSEFRFYLNADFDLTSSREDIDCNSAWNRWLVGQVSNVFVHLIEHVLALDDTQFKSASVQLCTPNYIDRAFLLGRILASLPATTSSSSTRSSQTSLTATLPELLRARLANLAWLPSKAPSSESTVTDNRDGYLSPNQLIILPLTLNNLHESGGVESSTHVSEHQHSLSDTVISLLIDRMNLSEPAINLLRPDHQVEYVDQSHCSLESTNRRLEALYWLGVCQLSIDCLLDLMAKLASDELSHQPGLLGVLMWSLELACSSDQQSSSLHLTIASSPMHQRQRALSTLPHLPIFPLTDDRLVRLSDCPNLALPFLSSGGARLLLPPSPGTYAPSVSGLTFDVYIDLLSKLGPLVKPSALFSQDPTSFANLQDLPSLLTGPIPSSLDHHHQHLTGLDIPQATPEAVISHWIVPSLDALSRLDLSKIIDNDQKNLTILTNWLIHVGQFLAITGAYLSDQQETELAQALPLVTVVGSQSSSNNALLVLPALRTYPALHRPSCLLLQPPDKMSTDNEMIDRERKLFDFVVKHHYQIDSDQPMFHIIAPDYFANLPPDVDIDPYRWLQLFSLAGACTLLSIHPIEYSLPTNAGQESPLPQLPSNHRLLQSVVDLDAKARDYNVKDWISPGLNLIVDTIVSKSTLDCGDESASPKSEAVNAAHQLTALISDNWPAFSNHTSAWLVDQTPPSVDQSIITARKRSMTVTTNRQPIRLADSSWLVKLKQSPWLPCLPPSTIRLVAPTGNGPVYSPLALTRLKGSSSTSLPKLFIKSCQVMMNTADDDSQLTGVESSPFLQSLGIVDTFDRSAYETVMYYLSALSNDQLDNHHLSTQLMLDLYESACSLKPPTIYEDDNKEKEFVQWLRSTFANPDRRCILVQCEPALFEDDEESNAAKRRRPDPDSSSCQENCYQLVKPSQLCWQSADRILDDTFTNSDDLHWRTSLGEALDADEGADDGWSVAELQCLYVPAASVNASLMPSCSKSDLTSSLADCYPRHCRTFFTDTLGLSLTSPLTHVLTLRPSPNATQSPAEWRSFGHRLGRWYAVLNLAWLEQERRVDGQRSVHHDPPSPKDDDEGEALKSSPLWNFPLLIDSNGVWHSPSELILDHSDSSSSQSLLLVAWSKPEMTDLFLHCDRPRMTLLAHSNALLGHSLFLHVPSAISRFTPSLARYDSSNRLSVLLTSGHCLLFSRIGLPDIDHKVSVRSCQSQSILDDASHTQLVEAYSTLLRLARRWMLTTINEHLSISDKLNVVESISQLLSADSTNSLVTVARNLHVTFQPPDQVCFGTFLRNLQNQLISASALARPCWIDDKGRLSLDVGQLPLPTIRYCSSPLAYAFALLSGHHTSSDQSLLLNQLAAFLFPSGGPTSRQFKRFIQGAVGLVNSLEPTLHSQCGQLSPTSLNQLSTYLLSHGIRPKDDVDGQLLKDWLVDANKLTRPLTDQMMAMNRRPESDSSATTSVFASETAISQSSSVDMSEPQQQTPPHVRTFTESSYSSTIMSSRPSSSSTRMDTLFNNLSSNMSLRVDSVRPAPSSSNLWSSEEASDWIASSDRLQRLLRSSLSPTNQVIGRLGELFAFERLNGLVKNQRYDLLQPTGHPLLGSGRLVSCRWVNANQESRQPYDLELGLEVECSAANWANLMRDLGQDLFTSGVIRIVNQPSSQQSHSNDRPGLLAVGPILVEVKSTLMHPRSQQPQNSDLFEMSVGEILCASQFGWRYHLLRVGWTWPTDNQSLSATDPSHASSPQPTSVIHVPDLVGQLRDPSGCVRMCVAMRSSDCSDTDPTIS